SISKSVVPGSVQEGGVGSQSVTYSYTVSNTSAASTDALTLSSILDDKVGDLLAAFQAANGGSAVLAAGASVTFTATQTVAVGNTTDRYSNTVTVTAADDEGDPASATTSATVTYEDVTPSLSISKSVVPGSVQEG